ncbi:MAG: efflux RND transporter permease subunit [Thermoanaerobaculia bacterium]|nr:efflux RND transporter permease subunit [Thermoanaerobaculia bacterium]
MRLIEISTQRRVTVSMVAIAICLFGLVAFSRLPINLLPDLSYPSLTIETRYQGAAPTEIEALLTRPIEESVGVVAGVQRISSVSKPGLSQVILEFGWDRDMDFAALDVRQKLDIVQLPRDAEKPVVLRFDPSNDPVLRVYLSDSSGGKDDLFRLRYVGEEVLKKDLESTEGLAAVKVHGGWEEEIQVQIDEGKLSLLQLDIGGVRDKLRQENINQAGGSLYEREARYLVRSRNEFETLDDIRNVVIRNDGDRLVTLGDVATVERGHKQRDVITRFGGEEAVELALYKEGDANTVQVAKAVQQRLDNLREELPEGVELVVGVDQSGFIQASIREVLSNATVGGLIAIVVLLLFLKDPRSTLIIAVSIPLSVVATFFLMYRTGTSLNIMSLGGLALGVGMLVDNAIVVLEAIYKKLEEGLPALDAARKGASEVGRAVVASTLTTVAVFLPVVFLEGVAAQLFRDQALTVSFSLIASLGVSLTLIPMLAALVAGKGRSGAMSDVAEAEAADTPKPGRFRRIARFLFVAIPSVILRVVRWLLGLIGAILVLVAKPFGKVFDAVMNRVAGAYPAILRWALRHRFLVVGTALLALGVSAALVPGLGVDLIPQMSQGEFSFRVELPEGTPLEATDAFVSDALEVLADDERVDAYSAVVGGAGLSLATTGTEGENVARLQVRMQGGTTPEDEQAVAGVLRGRLAQAKDADFEFERPSVFTFRTPIEVELYGDQLEDLQEASETLLPQLAEIPGVVDLQSSAELGNPELLVRFNRETLVQMGLDLSQVAAVVRNKVQGDVATRFTQDDREIDILVRSVELGEAQVTDVADLIVGQKQVGGVRRIQERTETGFLVQREVASGPGESVPIRLKTVADVALAEGPSEIRRIGQKRAAVISGNLEDRDMGAAATDLQRVVGEAVLPGTVLPVVAGQQEEMQRSLLSLLGAMALAAFLVYLVMASQFESFLHPFVIILTLPLGGIGVVLALALTGQTINVVAMIGAVMLAGIVVNNAIVLVDAVNQQRRDHGLSKFDALVVAGRQRLRPILMTSATTIFGLLPMALGLGEGAELRAPLAITVIGGLAVATVLTLVVIPVVYSLLDRGELGLEGSAETDTDDAAEAAMSNEAVEPA